MKDFICFYFASFRVLFFAHWHDLSLKLLTVFTFKYYPIETDSVAAGLIDHLSAEEQKKFLFESLMSDLNDFYRPDQIK